MNEAIALFFGLFLTLLVYSYLIGDNPLYRIAVHLLVGVSAAYAVVVAAREILVPVAGRVQDALAAGEVTLWLVPVLISLLLLLKWVRPVAWLGDSALAVLAGIGAAVALVGVIAGTLLPQILAVPSPNAFFGVLAALLTACALLYFQFTGGYQPAGEQMVDGRWQRAVAAVGRTVIMVTFGALFAGVLSTSLVLLTERVIYFVNGISELVSGLTS